MASLPVRLSSMHVTPACPAISAHPLQLPQPDLALLRSSRHERIDQVFDARHCRVRGLAFTPRTGVRYATDTPTQHHTVHHATQEGRLAGQRSRAACDKAQPGLCCILASGNHMFPAVRDVLQQLVVDNNLCVIKINPCNDWIGDALHLILRPLIDAGAVRIVYGAATVAQVRPLKRAGLLAESVCSVWLGWHAPRESCERDASRPCPGQSTDKTHACRR